MLNRSRARNFMEPTAGNSIELHGEIHERREAQRLLGGDGFRAV
jgi:hypothetical protein